jgi:glutamate formiminotransferase
VHPRLGAVDVVPFVPLTTAESEHEAALEAALSFARWWSSAYEVPVFLYGDADPKKRELPQARNTAFKSRAPDFGPAAPHEQLGATAVGVRAPLVAINCLLATRSRSRVALREPSANNTVDCPVCARSGSRSTRPTVARRCR